MGREKTGKPRSFPFLDLELRRLHIPDNAIVRRMVSEAILARPVPIGQYGQTDYGRGKYGLRYGFYGRDTYGQCSYG